MTETIKLCEIRVPVIDEEFIFDGFPEPCGSALELFGKYTLVAPGATMDRIRDVYRSHRGIFESGPLPSSCPFPLTASIVPVVIHTLHTDGLVYRKSCASWFRKRSPDAAIQHVYFMLCDAGSESLVKIGMSSGIEGRRRTIESCAPFPITCIGFIPYGGRALELKLHKSFSHLRVRGEWFRAAPELLGYIKQEAQPWPKKN